MRTSPSCSRRFRSGDSGGWTRSQPSSPGCVARSARSRPERFSISRVGARRTEPLGGQDRDMQSGQQSNGEMRMAMATIARLAERLRRAAETGQPIPPLRDELTEGGVTAAYAVQQANTEHYVRAGRRLVGRKIGLTSKSVQKQLGVDSPDFGMLFADMALCDGEEVALGRVMQPKVEAEIALVVERDLDRPGLTLADVISGIAYALPAIEIVGSRIESWNIRLLDTVADNASSGLFVLGGEPRALAAFDLRLCGMSMERRGEPVS